MAPDETRWRMPRGSPLSPMAYCSELLLSLSISSFLTDKMAAPVPLHFATLLAYNSRTNKAMTLIFSVVVIY